MERIRLKIFGITYSQVQNGAYALLLSQVKGPYRIPIVVGTAEAQSIAVKLENITPQRPMTHDLFVSFCHAFGVELLEVFIYKFKDGVFYSELKFKGDNQEISIDARTSDAIALALRTNAPIFSTKEIVEMTGFIFDEGSEIGKMIEDDNTEIRLDKFAVSELEKMMQSHVEAEEYEKAAEIKAIIKSKLDDKNCSN